MSKIDKLILACEAALDALKSTVDCGINFAEEIALCEAALKESEQ